MTSSVIQEYIMTSTTTMLLEKYSIDVLGSTKYQLKSELEKAKSSLIIKSIPLTEELLSILQSLETEKHNLESLLCKLKLRQNSMRFQLEHLQMTKAMYASYDIKTGGELEAHVQEKGTRGYDPITNEQIEALGPSNRSAGYQG